MSTRSRVGGLSSCGVAAAVILVCAAPAGPSGAAPTDAAGFLDSTARCAAPAAAAAFGSTSTSRVAICRSPDGQYEYRGVRVRDGAKMITAATATGDGSYTAQGDGVSYVVTASSLVVKSGDTVVRKDSWTDFQGGSAAAPQSQAPKNQSPGRDPSEPPAPTTPLPPPLPAEVGHKG